MNPIPSPRISLNHARMAPDDGGGGGGAPAGGGGAAPGAATGGTPPAPGQSTGAAPPPPRIEKVKYVANGKEIEEDVPYEKLVAAYQKRTAADEVFRTAAQQRADAARIQKENEEFQQLVLKDPIGAYKALRQRAKDATSQQEFDEVKYLTERLEERLNEAEQLKDPRERALMEERARREELEQRIRKDDEEKSVAEHKRAVAERKEQFAKVFGEALKHAKLPQNPFTMQSMARAFVDLKSNLPPGMDPAPEDIAEAVEADLAEVVEKGTEGLTGEALLTRYPSLTKRFFAALKERHQQRTGAPKPPDVQSPPMLVPRQKPSVNEPTTRARTPWDLKTI